MPPPPGAKQQPSTADPRPQRFPPPRQPASDRPLSAKIDSLNSFPRKRPFHLPSPERLSRPKKTTRSETRWAKGQVFAGSIHLHRSFFRQSPKIWTQERNQQFLDFRSRARSK